MTNSKLVLAVGLAAATLVVFLAVILSVGALRAGLAPWPGIGAIVLATAAFVVSWKQRSLLLAGLLAASGVTGIIAVQLYLSNVIETTSLLILNLQALGVCPSISDMALRSLALFSGGDHHPSFQCFADLVEVSNIIVSASFRLHV
jgi:hypothetical protein